MKTNSKRKLELSKETLRVITGGVVVPQAAGPPVNGIMMQDTKIMQTCSSCPR